MEYRVRHKVQYRYSEEYGANKFVQAHKQVNALR